MSTVSFGDIFFILVVSGIIWGIMHLVNRSRRLHPAQPPSVPDPVLGDSSMETIFTTTRVIAVVGHFEGTSETAQRTEDYLRDNGYVVFTVGRGVKSSAGREIFLTLEELPQRPDLVVIALPGMEVPPWAHSAVAVGARAVWMEKGTVCPEAMHLAREAGLAVVMDHSVEEQHRRLVQG